MSEIPSVIAVVGPTGVGKSAVADSIARSLGGEIVSADSMQVYRGMDIGTAKTPLDRRGVRYHCVDLVDPGTPYSAALYQRDARAAIDDIARRGHRPVVVGGTGLYVRAALDDMCFPVGEVGRTSRLRYEALAHDLGPGVLHELLTSRDPMSAALIHPNNVRRVVRALEMIDEGTSYARQSAGFNERTSVYPTCFIGLTMEREALYTQIEERVDAMVSAGLEREVRSLVAEGYRDALTAVQAIGYKELVPVLEQGAELAEAVTAIKQATRRYAKRQLSWFRADPRVVWLDVTGLSSGQAVERVQELIESCDLIPVIRPDE